MEGFKDGDGIAQLGQVSRAGKSGGAGAYDGDAVAVGGGSLHGGLGVGVVPVGHEALQAADGHGLALDAADTLGLALVLLGADAPADGGARGGLGDDAVGGLKIPLVDLSDEFGDVDAHGTACHTGGILTVEASGRLG